MSKLNRREFFQLFNLNKIAQYPKMQGQMVEEDAESHFDLKKIDFEVSQVIEKYLGLSKSNIELFLRPGHHVIKPNHIKLIKEKDINHITGELSFQTLVDEFLKEGEPSYSLYLSLKQKIMRLLNPGIGTAPSEAIYHFEAIKALIENGFTISTSDGSIGQLYQEKNTPNSVVSLMGVGILASLAGTSILTQQKNKIKRRKFLELVSKGSLASFATLAASYVIATLLPVYVPLKRIRLIEKISELQVDYEKHFLGNNEPIRDKFTKKRT